MTTTELAHFRELPQANALDLEELRGNRHSPEEIQAALALYARNGANGKRTARMLAADGLDVDEKTLADWARRRFPNHYQRIQEELAPRIEAAIVGLHRSVALRTAEAALVATDVELERLNNGEVKDAASSLRNLAVSSAVMTDKVLAMTGRPTSVVEHRTADQALKRLHAIHATIDSTAIEVQGDGGGVEAQEG